MYIDWINKKIISHSIGNYIQNFYVLSRNGKDDKIYIHTYIDIDITLNHVAVQQNLTQHCKSTTLKFKNKKTKIKRQKSKKTYEDTALVSTNIT